MKREREITVQIYPCFLSLLLAHYIFMWLSFFLSSLRKETKVKFAKKKAQEAKDEGRLGKEEEEDGARSVLATKGQYVNFPDFGRF